MPRERVAMRKIREILRLVWGCNQSRRDAGKACAVGRTTVNDTTGPSPPGFAGPRDEGQALKIATLWWRTGGWLLVGFPLPFFSPLLPCVQRAGRKAAPSALGVRL